SCEADDVSEGNFGNGDFEGRNTNSLDGDPQERKEDDVSGESFSKVDLNFEKVAKNLNNLNSQSVDSYHACVKEVGTKVVENVFLQIKVMQLF
nr:hypothetical protein [Tanacetum cinerariifolium]